MYPQQSSYADSINENMGSICNVWFKYCFNDYLAWKIFHIMNDFVVVTLRQNIQTKFSEIRHCVLDLLLTEILFGQNGIKSKFKISEISANILYGPDFKASIII